ncbi:MAG: hypothetical protein WKG07_05410 [Hymenobacter sp.]
MPHGPRLHRRFPADVPGPAEAAALRVCQSGLRAAAVRGNALAQFGPAFQGALATLPPQPGALFEPHTYLNGAHDNQNRATD